MTDKTAFLGLGFDDVSMHGAVETLLAKNAGEPFTYIVTPNTDHFSRLRKNSDLLEIYRAAYLCLLDSRLLWNLARMLNLPRPGVVTGADLTAALLQKITGQTVAVIGLQNIGFLALQKNYSGIAFQHYAPPMGLLNNPAAFNAARDFAVSQNAQFTFIALGSPLQEILAAAIAREKNATGIGLCIGAALEFCAGQHRRAPLWMQHAGLEWFYRLMHNPVRLARRYLLNNPPVLLSLLLSKLKT